MQEKAEKLHIEMIAMAVVQMKDAALLQTEDVLQMEDHLQTQVKDLQAEEAVHQEQEATGLLQEAVMEEAIMEEAEVAVAAEAKVHHQEDAVQVADVDVKEAALLQTGKIK